MYLQLPPTKDLALRHLLEAGLALIENQQIEENRRPMILDRLIEIFSNAELGSQAVQTQNLLFAAEQRSAFERYSLLFQYLDHLYGAELPTRLSETRMALDQLRQDGPRDEARLGQARDLIRSLIAAIKDEAALAPLEPPRTYQFG